MNGRLALSCTKAGLKNNSMIVSSEYLTYCDNDIRIVNIYYRDSNIWMIRGGHILFKKSGTFFIF